MSIATLKRKSYTLYGKDHTKNGQFSLNGTLRLPTQNLGRSVMHTPFRGAFPMGHGEGGRCRVGGWRARTCGGKYPEIITNSGACIIPQTEVKRSTMSNVGLLETSNKGILHKADAHVYRVDKDEGTYIRKLTRTPCKPSGTFLQTGYTEGYVQTSARCTPYTKNEDRPTYDQYYEKKTSLCVPILSPFKGNNTCA